MSSDSRISDETAKVAAQRAVFLGRKMFGESKNTLTRRGTKSKVSWNIFKNKIFAKKGATRTAAHHAAVPIEMAEKVVGHVLVATDGVTGRSSAVEEEVTIVLERDDAIKRVKAAVGQDMPRTELKDDNDRSSEHEDANMKCNAAEPTHTFPLLCDAEPIAKCPICESNVRCDSESHDWCLSIDWKKRFSGSTLIVFRDHCLSVHADEMLWNCLPKLDLLPPEMCPVGCRMTSIEATLLGLVHYSLDRVGEMILDYEPYRGMLHSTSWHGLKTTMTMCLFFAMSQCSQADGYFHNRTMVAGADPSESLEDQRFSLESKALRYLELLHSYIDEQDTPGPQWEHVSLDRRLNAFRNFFFERDRHIDCPILFHPWNDHASVLQGLSSDDSSAAPLCG